MPNMDEDIEAEIDAALSKLTDDDLTNLDNSFDNIELEDSDSSVDETDSFLSKYNERLQHRFAFCENELLECDQILSDIASSQIQPGFATEYLEKMKKETQGIGYENGIKEDLPLEEVSNLDSEHEVIIQRDDTAEDKQPSLNHSLQNKSNTEENPLIHHQSHREAHDTLHIPIEDFTSQPSQTTPSRENIQTSIFESFEHNQSFPKDSIVPIHEPEDVLDPVHDQTLASNYESVPVIKNQSPFNVKAMPLFEEQPSSQDAKGKLLIESLKRTQDELEEQERLNMV